MNSIAELCIYTHDARLFYRITKQFKEENIPFKALDKIHKIPRSAKVLLTTQVDLDIYKPKLPPNLFVYKMKSQENTKMIMLVALQLLNGIVSPNKIIFAVDPGQEVTGLAFFLDTHRIFSKCVFSRKEVYGWLEIFTSIYFSHKIQIKMGNGLPSLTKAFLNTIIKNQNRKSNYEFLLVDEVKTSKRGRKKGNKCYSIHENAAMLIGQRPGKLITANSCPELFFTDIV